VYECNEAILLNRGLPTSVPSTGDVEIITPLLQSQALFVL